MKKNRKLSFSNNTTVISNELLEFDSDSDEQSENVVGLPPPKTQTSSNTQKKGDRLKDISCGIVKVKPVSYYNSETDSPTEEVVTAADLVSNYYDYENDVFEEDTYNIRYERVEAIKQIPQTVQGTPEWLEQRTHCISATGIAVVLDEDAHQYPIELFLDKCGRPLKPFVENVHVHNGKKYEEIGNMYYSYRNNVKVDEYGLLQHSKYPFIGASPDGICDKYRQDGGLSKLVGRLLEIKFPTLRKIKLEGKLDGDICPHQYYWQIQAQLFVTSLQECDFLQCKVYEYNSWQEYLDDSHPVIPTLSAETNLEKGCLIQLLPKKRISDPDTQMTVYHSKYIYPPKLHMSPEEIKDWIARETMEFHLNELSEDYMIDRIIYWRLSFVACHLIKADPQMFKKIIPTLNQFWSYVEYYRSRPKALEALIEYTNEHGVDNSKLIFEKIHKTYVKGNPDTVFEPLYQQPTVWRKKHDNTRKFFNRGKH